jgi:hypothetical protein
VHHRLYIGIVCKLKIEKYAVIFKDAQFLHRSLKLGLKMVHYLGSKKCLEKMKLLLNTNKNCIHFNKEYCLVPSLSTFVK